jgi:hypothetical protein
MTDIDLFIPKKMNNEEENSQRIYPESTGKSPGTFENDDGTVQIHWCEHDALLIHDTRTCTVLVGYRKLQS